jgi:hypothetical protein
VKTHVALGIEETHGADGAGGRRQFAQQFAEPAVFGAMWFLIGGAGLVVPPGKFEGIDQGQGREGMMIEASTLRGILHWQDGVDVEIGHVAKVPVGRDERQVFRQRVGGDPVVWVGQGDTLG